MVKNLRQKNVAYPHCHIITEDKAQSRPKIATWQALANKSNFRIKLTHIVHKAAPFSSCYCHEDGVFF